MSTAQTIAITGLTTALLVGGYMHTQQVRALEADIATYKSAIQTPESRNVIEEFLHGLNIVPDASPTQGSNAAPDNWIYGAPSARYTLVEMVDTECTYCAKHFPVIQGMIEASGGHINAALLHVPALSEASRKQALAIECAGEQGGSDSAWKYAQQVFERTGGNGRGVSGSLVSLATSMGLDGKRFTACTESKAANDRVAADLEQVIKLGIQQTPSVMVIDNNSKSSVVLQGENSNQDGILKAIASFDKKGVSGEQ